MLTGPENKLKVSLLAPDDPEELDNVETSGGLFANGTLNGTSSE